MRKLFILLIGGFSLTYCGAFPQNEREEGRQQNINNSQRTRQATNSSRTSNQSNDTNNRENSNENLLKKQTDNTGRESTRQRR